MDLIENMFEIRNALFATALLFSPDRAAIPDAAIPDSATKPKVSVVRNRRRQVLLPDVNTVASRRRVQLYPETR
jgi:hypothetical protein